MEFRQLLRSNWVRLTLVGVTVLCCILVGLALAMTGWLGRAALVSVADGRNVAGFGTVTLEQVEGNVLSEFSVGRLVIEDEQGIWLVASDAQIRWDFSSALSDTLRIQSVDVSQIEVSRRPVRSATNTQDESGSAGPSLSLEALMLHRIALASPVVGTPADLRVEGEASSSSDGSLTVSAQAVRIDQPGDLAHIQLTRSPSGEIQGRVNVTAPPGGPLSTLFLVPTLGVSLTGELGGTVQSGAGQYQINIGAEDVSTGSLSWGNGVWSLNAMLFASQWPTLPPALVEFAPQVAVGAEGNLAPFSVGQLVARSSAFELEGLEFLTDRWQVDLQLTEQASQLTVPYGIEFGTAHARLTPATVQGDEAYAATIEFTQLTTAQVSAESISLTADVSSAQNAYSITLTGQALGLRSENARLSGFLDGQLDFDAVLSLTDDLGSIGLEALSVTAEGWNATADGAWSLGEGPLEGTAQLSLADVGFLDAGITGPVVLSATMRDEARVFVTALSSALSAQGVLGSLLGQTEARGEIAFGSSQLRVSDISLQTDALVFEGEAAQAGPSNHWSASGDGVFDLAVLGFDGLQGQTAIALEMMEDVGSFTLRAQAQTDRIEVAQTNIEAPVLRTQTTLTSSGVEGSWRLDGSVLDEPATVQGRYSSSDNRIQLEVDRAEWQSMRATASAQMTDFEVSVSLVAAEDTAGRNWSGRLDYRGNSTEPLAGTLVGRFETTGLQIGSGSLTRVVALVDGPLANLPVTLTTEGQLLGLFNLQSEGVIGIDDAGVTAQFDTNGVWHDQTIASRAPLRLTTNTNGAALAGALTIGPAQVELEATLNERQQIIFSVSDAPAQWISDYAGLPSWTGYWALEGDIANQDGRWLGSAAALVEGIRPRGFADDGRLDGEARLVLSDNVEFSLEARAGGLVAEATLARPEPINALETLLDPGWRGDVSLVGPLDTLAALYLPVSEQFSGSIDASALFEAGAVSGEVDIRDGLFVSQTAGVRLSPFSLQAAFSEDQLQIRHASLGDGNGGVATASGQIGFTGDGLAGDGTVQFERFNAVSRPELSVQATGASTLSLRGRNLRVTGEALIDRLSLTPVAPAGPSIPEIEVTELNRPETLDAPYRRPILIELDYRLRASDSLFVSSRTFNSEWAADVQAQGPINRLNLIGNARLQSGQASLLTRIFDVGLGEITFNGPIERTRILLEGRHQRAGLAVTARAEGPITQPRISFTSDPDRPEDEILSTLLFDQSTAALTPLQAAQLAAQLSGRNWLGALNTAGQRIGVDRLDVREGENGQIALVGGRRIADNVYLELETSTAAALGAARIEWSITPDIVVLSRLTGDTNGELAIRWRLEFD